jgi:tetratricopeptide (TPR) repeat protein
MVDPSDIRRGQIEDDLRQDMELLKEWEDKFRLAENPTERKRCEAEIARLKQSISKLTVELDQLRQQTSWQEQAPVLTPHLGKKPATIAQVFRGVVFQLLSPRAAIVIIIIAALAVAATGLLYPYRQTQAPDRMTGDFNIAVAQFGEVTDQGIVPSALATQIGKLLFDFLDSEYRATDFGLNIQVAYKKIGPITESREAEQLAADIGADIVIYGSVFVTGDEATLSPRFYVANRPDIDIGELTGQYQLALPIQFEISSLGFQDKVNAELRSRTAILVHVTEGLVYLSANNLEAATRSAQEAIREAERHGPFDGQEVLYVLAAHTNTCLGNLEAASKYVDQALALNPECARAYIARGNIYYAQAIQASLDESKLNQALAEYKRALEAQDQPAGAYITEKVNAALGNVYVVQAQKTDDPELFAKAIYHYNQVVDEYEKTKNEGIRELTAIAYSGLGAAYERQKDYAQAKKAYRRCIDLTRDSVLRAKVEERLGTIK